MATYQATTAMSNAGRRLQENAAAGSERSSETAPLTAFTDWADPTQPRLSIS
jgi:hypothetical protein